MSGFNIPQGQDLGGAMSADPMMKKRLLSAMNPILSAMGGQQDPNSLVSYGSQPTGVPRGEALPAGRGPTGPTGGNPRDRLVDDPVSRNQPAPTGDFVNDAPRMAEASRTSLAQQMSQPPAPDRVQQLQSQYDSMQPPQQKPMATWKKLLFGAMAGPGAGHALAQRQQNQQFEEGRYDTQRRSLAQQIEEENKMREQEQLSTDRMSLQERMQSERERAQQASQERVFGQQQDIEGQRETLRQKMQRDQQDASDARQQAQFAQQQKAQQAQFGQQTAQQQRQFAEQEKIIPLREEAKAKGAKATADEERRADLARNMNENLDQLEEIINRRPDLFGKMGGRKTEMQQNQSWWNPFAGTGDKDVAALKTIKEQMGMAMVGAHAMRNAQHVATAADAVLSGFLNSPDATKQAIKDARSSLATFQQDRDMGGGANAARTAQSQQQQKAQPSGKSVSLAAARQLPQNKGKSDDEIRKHIESFGHTVAP